MTGRYLTCAVLDIHTSAIDVVSTIANAGSEGKTEVTPVKELSSTGNFVHHRTEAPEVRIPHTKARSKNT